MTGYTMTTTRGNTYTLDQDGKVTARSNGPKGWQYSGQWIILGAATRHHANRWATLEQIIQTGNIPGQGWIHDLDHGTHRVWGMERMKQLTRNA